MKPGIVQVAIFLQLIVFSTALSKQTRLRIVNNLKQDVTKISVFNIKSKDWEGEYRPDKNIDGTSIKSGSFIEAREEVNRLASNCPIGLLISYADGTKDKFQFNQKYAIGKAKLGLLEYEKPSHLLTFERKGDTLVITLNPKV